MWKIYPNQVAEKLRIIGDTNRVEVDAFCFMEFTAQETRIQRHIDANKNKQTEAMRDALTNLGIQV